MKDIDLENLGDEELTEILSVLETMGQELDEKNKENGYEK